MYTGLRDNCMVVRNKIFLVVMLGALDTLTPISIDMYLPAFPRIAAALHCGVEKLALSVSLYFFGFAIGQLLYGPLLDRFGVKKPLYAGLALYVLASTGCLLSGSLPFFLAARFFQALGGCVAAVAAIAMVRDFFSPGESARVLSLMILILGISPLLAPTIGSLLVSSLGWEYIFVTLAAAGLLLVLAVMLFLPEAHPGDTTVSLRPAAILKDFGNILAEPAFLLYVLAGSFAFAALFVYVAGSPGIFMQEFRLGTKMYGGVFALLSVGFIGGSQLNHYLTRRYSNRSIFKVVLVIQFMTSLVYLLCAAVNRFGVAGNMVCLSVILACAGLSYPNAVAVALAPFTRNTGSASALLGFLQIGIGGAVSACVGLIRLREDLSVSLVIAGTTLVAFAVLMMHKNPVKKIDPGIKPLMPIS